jgi:DNA-binding response OmpR family regulator
MSELNTGKVLFLDDDKFLLGIYKEKFADAKCVLQTAETVDDALRILRGGFVPDVLIVDLQLPGKDGFVFLESIHQQHLAQGAYVMVLTNHSEENDRKRANDLGIGTYIIKAEMIPDEVVRAAVAEITKKNTGGA